MKDKVFVIVGGLGLLGRAITLDLLEKKCKILVADIKDTIPNDLTKQVRQLGASKKLNYTKLDITSLESVDASITLCHEEYSHIDGLVNTAYPKTHSYGKDMSELSYDEFCENLNINLGGYFLTTQRFSKYFYNQGFGNILNIASIYGVIPPRFSIYKNLPISSPIEYAAIKSGLIHISKYFAKYYKGKNLRFNTVSPGGIFDDHEGDFSENYAAFCLNKGLLDPKDICGTISFLLSNESEFINGQNIIVDDGFTL